MIVWVSLVFTNILWSFYETLSTRFFHCDNPGSLNSMVSVKMCRLSYVLLISLFIQNIMKNSSNETKDVI